MAQLSIGILGQDAGCLVLITLDDKALPGGDREKRKHVATRQCRDKRFFGIDRRFDREREWDDMRRRRGANLDSSVEVPGVFTTVPLVGERGAVSVPFDHDVVLAHVRIPACPRRAASAALH